MKKEEEKPFYGAYAQLIAYDKEQNNIKIKCLEYR